MAVQRKRSTATAALGLTYVQKLVQLDNSIFNKIDQDNDVGNDAYIEFTQDGLTTGCCIAAQIKSGTSYLSSDGKKYLFKADQPHFDYWAGHALPVCGIVYDPTNDIAAWCDITGHLTDNPAAISRGPYTIAIPRKRVLSPASFATFKRHFIGYHSTYSSDAIFARTLTSLTQRENLQICFDAIKALFSFHRERFATWFYLWSTLRYFRGHRLLPSLVLRLAHIPGHGDIFWGPKNLISVKTSRPVVKFMREAIGREEIVILLECIDENGFNRGSLGQCVWSLVDVARDREIHLRSILSDATLSDRVRCFALWLVVVELQVNSKEEAIALIRSSAAIFADPEQREMISGMGDALTEGRGLSLW